MAYRRLYFVISLFLLLILLVNSGCITIKLNSGKNSTTHEELKSGDSVDESLKIEKGDPDWWKKQPDLKQEETTINNTINQLNNALNTKDVEQAITYFSPEVSDKYREIFSRSPDMMPQIAAHLKKAKINFLSATGIDDARIAEYSLEVDGYTFHILLIKIDTRWLIKSI